MPQGGRPLAWSCFEVAEVGFLPNAEVPQHCLLICLCVIGGALKKRLEEVCSKVPCPCQLAWLFISFSDASIKTGHTPSSSTHIRLPQQSREQWAARAQGGEGGGGH